MDNTEIDLSNYEKTLKKLRTLLKNNPGEACEIYFQMGNIYREMNQLSTAKFYFKKLSK